MGNLLRRLAAKCAASAVAAKAAHLLSPNQLGVGVKSGCEAIVHATWQALVKEPNKFLLQCDLINAFNQCDRGAALKEVAEHFPELLNWVKTCYAAPSHLLFGKAAISSQCGFHQGDPLASLLFALVLHPIVLKIQHEVPSLSLNAWFLDDGTLVGDPSELGQVVDIIEEEGPVRGLHLSTRRTVGPNETPKTTLWCPHAVGIGDDPLQRGIPFTRGLGVTLLGAPIGWEGYTRQFLQEKVDKVAQITALLPNIQDPHAEFALLRSTLALPKLMFTLRTVTTIRFPPQLQEFDSLTREALTRILGSPLEEIHWQQAKLPVSLGGLGLRAAEDHAAAAFCSSFLTSQPLVQQLLSTPEPAPLAPVDLAAVSIKVGEEVDNESLQGLTQKALTLKVDLANQQLHSSSVTDLGEREVARMAALSLPHAGDWLNCPPIPALGLHLRAAEFVVATKFRLGMKIFDKDGACPACLKPSDSLGDHAVMCGTGGERIARHNFLRDALFETAASAGLAPSKEGRALLPGNQRRPADVLIPHWSGGRDGALDVTVTHPLQDLTRAGEAAQAGHALTVAYDKKMKGASEQCSQQGLAFIPIVAESFGGWHQVAQEQIKKLAACLARHTGQDEGEATSHLFSRCALLLQRGLAALLLNRIPTHAPPEIDGCP